MKRKRGIIAMILGAVMILGAFGLVAYNRVSEQRAGSAVEKVLPEIEQVIESNTAVKQNPYYVDSVEMETVEIDGNDYIGVLSFPNLELELPVLSTWDYSLLKLSPCRYAGSVKDGSLVIAGHNYTRHFGMLENLAHGDEVFFTDATGNEYRYTVSEVELLQKTAIYEMKNGDWDLTLFTCNYSGQQRISIRCEREPILTP